jgi:FdhE protein
MTSSNSTPADSIRKEIDEACRLRPHLVPFLQSVTALLEAEEKATAEMPVLDRVQVVPERFAKGAPALAGLRLECLQPHLLAVAEIMLPALAQSFPQAEALVASCTPEDWKDRPLAEAVRMYLDGNRKGLDQLAESWGVDKATLPFILEMIQRPVLCRLAEVMANILPTSVWKHGYCPLCGQAPAMSYLSKSQETENEFLRGGGGQKILSCGLCGFEWNVSRAVCVACGNKEPGKLECLKPESNPGERIELCMDCKTYCLGLDLREFENCPHPRIAPLAHIHLDMLAQERGYSPLAWTPWNSFGKADV